MRTLALNLLMAIAAVLAPAQGMISAALFLITADLITGLVAAHKLGKPITSAGLQRTVVKIFLYESAIILSFLTETYLLNHSIPAASIVAGFVGLTELKSCLENLDVIGGGGVLKQVIEKLGSQNKD